MSPWRESYARPIGTTRKAHGINIRGLLNILVTGSFVQVVFLHECVPSADSVLDFYAPDGVNDKIHAVIIDVRVDGKFDILLNLVNGQIAAGPTERTVLHCFYEKPRQFSLNLAFVADECESFRFCHRVSFLSKYTLGRKFSTD